MMMPITGPVEARRILMSTVPGRCVLVVFLALLALVGIAAYVLRSSIDQSLGLLVVAVLYCALLASAPQVDRFARRR
jgi:hypothetical protein